MVCQLNYIDYSSHLILLLRDIMGIIIVNKRLPTEKGHVKKDSELRGAQTKQENM